MASTRDQGHHVKNADAHRHLVRHPALLQVRVLVRGDGVVLRPDAHVAEQVGDPQLLDQRLDEDARPQRKGEPVAARLELRDVRVAVGVVDELMMGEVLQAIMLGAS